MRRIRNLACLQFALSATASGALFCTPNTSVASPGETVHVKAFSSEPVTGAQFQWSVTGGKIVTNGAEADWTFSDVQPRTKYFLKVVMKSAAASEDCGVQVATTAGPRGGDRETARTLLARGSAEEAGFGLYSYLLLGSAPDNTNRERYLAVIREYLRLCPSLAEMRTLLAPKQLNANYLPTTALPRPNESVTAEWLLANYDFSRARAILRTVPGSHFRGPYILSALKPAVPTAAASGPIFFQDLSNVPLDLVRPWYEAFLNQAAQEHFWEEKSGELFALKLRTLIGVLAQGLPDVKTSMASWIQWLK
jgi:hypothetical protein